MGNSSTNGTIDFVQTETSFTATEISAVVLLSVLLILGIPANGLVIYVTGFKMKTTVNSVWFLNLALADFIFIITLSFICINLFLFDLWQFGKVMYVWKFMYTVHLLTMLANIFLLTAISLDRCLSIWLPVWARNSRTPNKARLICGIIWLLSVVCSIPSGLYSTVVTDSCGKSEDALTNKRLAMLYFVIGFLIPFLMITCCYVAIGVRANQIKREKKIRPFLIILAVILSFFIFWLPIHIVNLIIKNQIYNCSIDPKHFGENILNMAEQISLVPVILALLHSSLNPFLYMLMCEKFRQKLKQSVFVVLEHAFAEEPITSH